MQLSVSSLLCWKLGFVSAYKAYVYVARPFCYYQKINKRGSNIHVPEAVFANSLLNILANH